MKELFETGKYFFAGNNAVFPPAHASMAFHRNEETVEI